jgi:hypothetical protein
MQVICPTCQIFLATDDAALSRAAAPLTDPATLTARPRVSYPAAETEEQKNGGLDMHQMRGP